MKKYTMAAALWAAVALLLGGGGQAQAGPIQGTMFYTTFSGGQNVHKVDFNYNGSSSFVLSNNTDVAATPGADGLVFTSDGFLAVGGQGPTAYRVDPLTGSGSVFSGTLDSRGTSDGNKALTPSGSQYDRPYALGTMEIVPALDTKFTKKSELSTFMLIYNPKVDSANKPDVTIEYNFYQKLAGQPEKFFNKTTPQSLNAQTLPPQFDLAAGHQLQSGQAVPLASFPEGEYRLEIKVTDKIANKTLTREIVFSVGPA